MMPDKKSSKWLIVFIIYTAVIFIAFLVNRLILSSTLMLGGIIGILLLSVLSAILPCLGGYFGKRIFFILYTISVIVGIIYSFYTVVADTAPGWGDLASMISYLFILAIGFLIAINAEIIYNVIHNRKSNKL